MVANPVCPLMLVPLSVPCNMQGSARFNRCVLSLRMDRGAITKGAFPLRGSLQSLLIRYFWNHCDRDPPTEDFKNFKFFQTSLKILNVYFWGDNIYFWGNIVYFWGYTVYFWGTKVYSTGFSTIWGFLEFLFFLLGGGFGTLMCSFPPP